MNVRRDRGEEMLKDSGSINALLPSGINRVLLLAAEYGCLGIKKNNRKKFDPQRDDRGWGQLRRELLESTLQCYGSSSCLLLYIGIA